MKLTVLQHQRNLSEIPLPDTIETALPRLLKECELAEAVLRTLPFRSTQESAASLLCEINRMKVLIRFPR